MNLNKLGKEQRAGLSFSAVIIVFAAFSFMASFAINGAEGFYKNIIVSLLAPAAIALSITFLAVKGKENFFAFAKVKKFNPVFIAVAIVLGVAAIFAFGTLNELFAKLLTHLGLRVTANELEVKSVGEYAAYLVFIAVLPAVSEEALFRGVIAGALNGKRKFAAAIVTALSFALYHNSLTQLLFQFVYGLILFYLTLSAGSVIPCMIAHFINNAFIITVKYFGLTVDLFAWQAIVCGIVAVILCLIPIIFFVKKRSVSEGESKTVLFGNYFIYASFGFFVCVLTAVAGAL